MKWLKTPDERCCGMCGVVVEHWVLHKNEEHQVADATFCPICYPDLKTVFEPAEPVSAPSGGGLQSASVSESDESLSYPFLLSKERPAKPELEVAPEVLRSV